jgi:peptide/nickel transport system substrate-binding protein
MSQLTVQPIGQSSNDNFNRYVSPDADKILAQFSQTADPTLQKQYASQLEAIFVKEAPALPLFPGVDWYEYSSARFNGFPSQDNAYAPGVPWPGGPYNTALIVLTTITPK